MYFCVNCVEYDGCGGESIMQAESEEAAIRKLYAEGVIKINSIREISLEERIERETESILFSAISMYEHNHFANMTIREAAPYTKDIDRKGEEYYKALVEFSNMMWYAKRVIRIRGSENLTVKELTETVDKMIKAKTEEQRNLILHGYDE